VWRQSQETFKPLMLSYSSCVVTITMSWSDMLRASTQFPRRVGCWDRYIQDVTSQADDAYWAAQREGARNTTVEMMGKEAPPQLRQNLRNHPADPHKPSLRTLERSSKCLCWKDRRINNKTEQTQTWKQLARRAHYEGHNTVHSGLTIKSKHYKKTMKKKHV
jgi:hypothetical protein